MQILDIDKHATVLKILADDKPTLEAMVDSDGASFIIARDGLRLRLTAQLDADTSVLKPGAIIRIQLDTGKLEVVTIP